MAKRRNRKRILTILLERYGPILEAAFLNAIDTIVSDVQFSRLVEQIARGDIAGALGELRIDTAVFSGLSAEIAQAYATGAAAGTQSMPKRRPNGAKLIVRFDGANPDAERELKQYSSTAVKEIVDDQLDMARDALSAGLSRGDNPRTVALDLVGRYDPKAGKRTGGFIGLTKYQEGLVQNAANELTGGPAELNAYLQRKLRNKSFDRYVRKAIEDGKPIPADIRQKMISRMKDNFLKARGDTIGRTEAMSVLHMGRYRAFAQAIQDGEVSPEEIERTWRTARDSRVRHSHEQMDGQVVGMFEHYTTPSGAKLMYPGDPDGPAKEIINCRCEEDIRINFLSRLKRV